ncbi:MAG: glycerophosphodiester phosphodiesterase family protein [Verrucomicrobiales bacterium]|nr:glycerophosphodiester phosphodiesterase family protein [Verrucomicrobiales bacterium]
MSFRSRLILASALGSALLAAESGADQQGQAPLLLKGLNESIPPKVLIAAHRGGYESDLEDQATENSVANIEVSHRKGFQIYETDIQKTQDGHFVIVHDPTIERETNRSGKISEMTLNQVKELRKRYRKGAISEDSIATLEEFLIAGKDLTVFKADLKPGVSDYFGEIMDLVTKHRARDGIIFRVPYYEAKRYETFLEEGGSLEKHTLMFKVNTKNQIDHIKESFDSTTIEIKLSKADPVKQASLDLITYARAKGFIVETHAEGDAADWRTLIGAGVRIFHTSSPSKMQALLNSTDE